MSQAEGDLKVDLLSFEAANIHQTMKVRGPSLCRAPRLTLLLTLCVWLFSPSWGWGGRALVSRDSLRSLCRSQTSITNTPTTPRCAPPPSRPAPNCQVKTAALARRLQESTRAAANGS